jgi:hypothetical protein
MRALFGFGVGVLLASAAAHASEPTVALKTVDGKTVDVTETAVRNAYSSLLKGGALNQVTENEDGSVSVINPRVQVAGVATPVIDSSSGGLCALKGYGAVMARTLEDLENTKKAIIDASGHVIGLGYYSNSTIEILICAKKQ